MLEKDKTMSAALQKHFTPAFEMLEKAIEMCPDNVWTGCTDHKPFWQHIYHTVTGIQFWFRNPGEKFELPDYEKDVTPDLEMSASDYLTKEELGQYTQKMKEKAQAFFAELDDERLFQTSGAYDKLTNCDVILMQIGHFQHHVGYSNSLLAQNGAAAVNWVESIV